MPNTASRLSANGSLTISGSFDEVTRIIPDGLILYYDAGKSYSNGFGNTVFDLSSSNNTGIIAGSFTNSFGGATNPVYASANSGYFILNGNGGYITSSILYSGPSEFTIGVWFRTASTTRASKLIGFGNSQYQNSISGTTTFETSYDRHLWMGADNRVYFGIYPNQVVSINSSSTYTDNVWHYAVGTFSGSQSAMRLYVDGALIGSNTQFNFAQPYSGYWKIGAGSLGGWPSTSPGANYFLGDIGPAKVYSRALTAAEVLQNYNVDATRFSRTTTPYAVNKLTANTTYITGEFDEVTYNPNNIGPTKNLFQNSEDFTQQFTWGSNSLTFTKNSAIAPDGKQTATLVAGTGLYPLIIYYAPGSFNGYKLVEPGKFYTHSIFVKYVNQSRCSLVNESSPVGGYMIFDLLTGTLQVSVNGSITRATITPFPNGWWRISATYLIPSTSYATNPNEFYWQPQWRLGNYDNTNYSGSQMLVWGSQLEEGNTASTYVATGFPKNILLFTDELTTPSTYYWYRENCTITKNATISPDGNYNGFLLSSTINGGSNTGFFQRFQTNLPINTNYTYSVYLKQGTSPTTFLNFYNVSPFSQLIATITWPAIYGNGPTVSYSGDATRLASTITDAGNGWWRFSLSMNNGSSSALVWRVYVTTNGVTNVIGNSVYVWGPQLEFGLTPTTLIQNNGNFTNTLPLANTNMVMKTTNTGNTFIKDTFDEVYTGGLNMVTNGLTLYMDAAKLDSYPGTGTRWNDIGAGSNFNATFTSTPNFIGGQYIAFNGTYHANTGKTPAQLGMYNQPFTAMALFRVPDVALSVPGGTNDHMVLGTATTLTQQGLHLGTRNNTFHMGFYAADVNTGGIVVPNRWYFVTWVWSSVAPHFTIYVDGVSRFSGGSNLPFLGTTNLLIGSSAVGTQSSDVNMVAIYNRALSQAEVTQNYNAFRGPFGI
jgi:hypothetical protein